MKKNIKAGIYSLALISSLGLGMIAEAGRIPSHMVPLQTYATKKLSTYKQIGGRATGWIDAGDYVVVNQIRSDGWAKGTYPVGSKRIERWFRVDDLLNNPSFTTLNRMSPKYTIKVYKNYSYNGTIGSVWGNADLWVVSNLGDVWQIVYKLDKGGYKMGWVPYWDCLEKQKPKPTPILNPIIKTASRTQLAKRSVYVYTDSSLTKYYTNCGLVNGQSYTVTGTAGNALKVKFNNKYQGNQETNGWVSNEIQQNLSFAWPTASKHLSVVYYYRNTKGENGKLGGPHSCHYHENNGKRGVAKPLGIDIAGGNDGQEVKATEGGTVLFAGWDASGFGNKVIIDHGEGKCSLYGHLKYQPIVKVNQYVRKGQRIGFVGNTHSGSYSMGSHLHFEMSWINPYEYFKGKQTFTYEEPAKSRNAWNGADYWSGR